MYSQKNFQMLAFPFELFLQKLSGAKSQKEKEKVFYLLSPAHCLDSVFSLQVCVEEGFVADEVVLAHWQKLKKKLKLQKLQKLKLQKKL